MPEAGPHEAQAAAAAAAEAFRRRPAPGAPGAFDDADLLEAVAGELEAVTADLVDVAGRETGLAPERLRGEVARTVGQLRAFAAARRDGLLADADHRHRPAGRGPAPARPAPRRHSDSDRWPSSRPRTSRSRSARPAETRRPPSPRAARSCSRRIPAHPATSAVTGAAVSAAVERVGAPAAWFQVLHGAAVELGQALASAPDVAAVAFTGSLRAGRALFDAAARREVPIPVFAEMGSLNPVAVTPAALAARAPGIAAALAGTVLASAGQLCTKPNLVLVVEGPGLTTCSTGSRRPCGTAASSSCSTRACATASRPRGEHLVQASPVREVVPARASGHAGAWQTPGLATVPARTLLEEPGLLEEHFGPGTVVAVAQDGDELVRLAGALPGSLTATIHAQDGETGGPLDALAATLAARSGRLVWNGVPTGVTVGHATVHGGPYPATTAPATTSVGTAAARRFQRPVGLPGLARRDAAGRAARREPPRHRAARRRAVDAGADHALTSRSGR